MARYFVEEAIILSTQPHREADLLLHLFGQLRGAFRALAPNALKSTHRFMGALTSFAHVNLHFVWPRGSTLPRLVAADTVENFSRLWSKPNSYALAKAMCESVQKTLIEGEPMPKTFHLLLYHLRWLSEHSNPEGVFSSFMLIFLEHLGFLPVVDKCARCGKKFGSNEYSYLLSDEGGLVCERCAPEHKRAFPVLPAARRALFDIAVKRRGKKEALPEDEKISLQLVMGLAKFFEHYLQKPLFAVELWGELKANEIASPKGAA